MEHQGGAFSWENKSIMYKGKVCIRVTWSIRLEFILVSLASSDREYFYSPLDGMLGLPPALSSPVPIYTPGWKEAL